MTDIENNSHNSIRTQTDNVELNSELNDRVTRNNSNNDNSKKSINSVDDSKNSSGSSSTQKESGQNKPKEPEAAPAEDHSLRNEILLNVGLTVLSFVPITAPFALGARAIILARSAYGAAKAVSMGVSAARAGNAAVEVTNIANTTNRVNKIIKIGDKAESKIADKIEDKITDKIESKIADKIENRAVSRTEQSSARISEKPDNKSNSLPDKKENKSSLNRDKKERDRDSVDFSDSTRRYLDDDKKVIQEKEKKQNKIEAYGGGFAGLCAFLQIISQSLDEAQNQARNDNDNGLDMDENRKKMSPRTRNRFAMLGKAGFSLSAAEMGANTLDDMQAKKDSLEDYDVLKLLQDTNNKDNHTKNNNSQNNHQSVSFNQSAENINGVKM